MSGNRAIRQEVDEAKTARISSRIRPSTDALLEHAIAGTALTKQDAVCVAIEQWLAKPSADAMEIASESVEPLAVGLPAVEAAALKYIAYHMSLPLRDPHRDAFVRHFVTEIIERMKTRPMPE